MTNALKKIRHFNTESGLLAKGYNSLKESEYLIEEALEELDTHYLAEQLGLKPDVHPKVISRKLVTGMCLEKETSTVALVDKHLNSLAINIKSLMKLGLANSDIVKGINILSNNYNEEERLEHLSLFVDKQ